jgi:hypothetical protein
LMIIYQVDPKRLERATNELPCRPFLGKIPMGQVQQFARRFSSWKTALFLVTLRS